VNQNPTNRIALVIEDEIHLADIFAKALEMAGYLPQAINDGQEAMDHLQAVVDPPALIVLDLNLPLLSGKEILRFIRKDPRFVKTRVIMATSDSAAIVGEIEAKSDIVLLKPIGFTQLRELASRFL
jgi:phosphoserine phosphatase RsbU/P